MKIQIASDLHLEMRSRQYPPASDFQTVENRDVLVLAGDIGNRLKAWAFVERELAFSPVIYVPGNHEYYGRHIREETDEAWRRKSELHAGLHYLTGEVISLGGLRFWGGPWYSDFFGCRDQASLHDIGQLLNDFSARHNDAGRWTVARHLKEHARQTQLLSKEAGHVDVVITHWPPTIHAVAPQDEGDLLNGYYVNDREDLVEEIGAQCWISGHVHDAYRAVVGDTLVIGNPAGYPQEKPERRLFRPNLAIEVKPGAWTELAE